MQLYVCAHQVLLEIRFIIVFQFHHHRLKLNTMILAILALVVFALVSIYAESRQ